ncbi:DUF305 domain-containing protein [Frigidibacter oleivorans]|uniref:DUF305 domain-containing protein n=1 Tax=Frigidibacter oleivorans TaxID=2487129 RepID=UPI000F8EC714|nr:DUF305 domain-containing protein [Frigidibacter oleivorans]
MSYRRFAAMIATSTIVMFGLMYLNTYALEHVYFSQTRAWMALLMGAVMAIVMLAFMRGMYPSRTVNAAIFAGAALVFALSLYLVRSQATVGQVSWMKAMIPHHSIAILTSERADIRDPRVRKLADEIIAAQRREISEMRYLVAELTGDAAPAPAPAPEPPPEPAPSEAATGSLAEALASEVLATVDPVELTGAEVTRALGDAAPGDCSFRRTGASGPILVLRPAASPGATTGLVKISDTLIALTGAGGSAHAPVMAADGLRLAVLPQDESAGSGQEADLRVDLETASGQSLSIGYRGVWDCGA